MQCEVFWTKLDQALPVLDQIPIMRNFPPAEIAMIKRLKFPTDRDLTIAGKLLLANALTYHHLDISVINSIKRQMNNKPYLKSAMNYNISHSGKIAVCATCYESVIGVDIEQIIAIELSDFENCFNVPEWRSITSANNPQSEFYRLWTRKEAFLKAIGTGLTLPLAELNCFDNTTYDELIWQILPFELDPQYWCHLAVPTADCIIQCHYVDIFQHTK